MVSHLNGFRLARFRLTTLARERLALPDYKRSALRGGFGHVFRKIGCMASSLGAGQCTLRERCPYHYIFETPPPAGSQILDKVPTAPQPFILEPPLDTKRFYEPGEELSFGLILIGRAIDYLPYFIYAFDELGRNGIGKGKGKYQLHSVTSEDQAGHNTQIYWPEKHLLKDGFSILRADDLFSPLPLERLCHKSVYGSTGSPRTDVDTRK
ncbi:MAG: hypothetical protein HYY65_11720, partial [Candidatus Tectomicrobia bacterium]|nr:hypothetical protein [Candidatus Tectomicrobia bacterium]